MEKSAAVGSTPVPPYESNPQYGSPPPAGQYGQQPAPMMHQQDSYQINQAPNQGQYHQQPMSPQQQPMMPPQQPMSPQPQGETKPEGSYYAGPQHPGMGQQQASQPQVVVLTQGQQPPPQPSQYHTATPLPNLGEGSAPVDCPSCRTRALTRTQYVSGNTTLAWAAVICICTGLGCIPFLVRGLKDVEHNCGHCGIRLATWHNSGRTVVQAHG